MLETSCSYRLTYPLRKAEEVFKAVRRIPRAIRFCLQPGYRKGFDAEAYLASSSRPHGWWRRFPALHYCLFAVSEGGDDGKYDTLDRRKPTVILVTHQVCRTGAPILVLDLLSRFTHTHNVVVFSIGGGALEPRFREKSTVFVGPIARSNLPFVLDQELTQFKRRVAPEFAVVNSLEATEVVEGFWRQDVPVLHLVHEFAAYTRPRTRLEKSACFSSAMVFSAEIVRANAIGAFPQIEQLARNIFPQGTCALPESLASGEEKAREQAAIQAAFRPQNWPEETIVVLGAGTVQLRKGLHLFLSCAKKVIESHPRPPVRFVWIGSGFNPEEDLHYSCFIDEQIKRSALGDSFVLLNEVNELQCAYDSADIFFLSSKLDPLPLVAQDALFNKLPLVCFEGASGIPEYIGGDPEASFGVAPYLDVEAAAEKILRLAGDRELRKKTGEAGRRIATRIFDQAEYFSQLNKLGLKAAAEKRDEIQDRRTIRESDCFDVSFAYPRLVDEKDLALRYYTTSWRTGIYRRKPFPGFHPGIYADHHAEVSSDPLAHFIRSGKPEGPWLSEVILPGESRGNEFSVQAALHVHLHYPGTADEIFSRLSSGPLRPDLFISVTSEAGMSEVGESLERFSLKAVAIRIVPGRGRDIGPLLTAFPEMFDAAYEFIGHVHGKKSVNLGSDFARQWALFLFENLLGGGNRMLATIFGKLQSDPGIGLVFPDDPHVVGWEKNREFALELAANMEIPLPSKSINFPVGTMFWARTQALKPLADLHLRWEDYPEEPLPYDGSMLHAIERLLPFVAAKQGFRSVVSHVPGLCR